ncbi:transglycosylase SLT domain-containing protein [Silanimonas sp.]|uniref:transglycosylase SLT domain-containing protein n=1 Tax=Silanimonas sp. TaxID=1929290 RepID=UPI0037C783AC
MAVLALAGLAVGCTTLPAPVPAGPPDPVAVEEPSEPLQLAPTPAPKASVPRPEAEAEAEPAPPARIADGRVLFERLAGYFGPPVCVRGDHNRQWRRRYAGHPASFERQLRDALPLMAYVVEAVEARNLPGEFALIPIVESGYRPEARGPGGPTGLWQMIGSTARNHGVQVGRGYDGRLSPVDATDAALDYLAVLHAEFGDWRATAMAYNAGEGRLRRAFARDGASRVSGERRLPAGLSSVTYAYVAKLHALACLIAEPARHGLTLPVDAFTPLEARRAPDGATRLDAVARAWGTSPESLARWNPAYRAGIALPGAPRRLLAPVGTVAATEAMAAPSNAPSADSAPTAEAPRQHTVRSGETLWRIARRYGTTVRALAAFNGIDAARPLRIGRTLRIPD